MNFPNAFDRSVIDSTYASLPRLITDLGSRGIPVIVPR